MTKDPYYEIDWDVGLKFSRKLNRVTKRVGLFCADNLQTSFKNAAAVRHNFLLGDTPVVKSTPLVFSTAHTSSNS